MGKLRPWPTDFIQLIGRAHMRDLNTQLKKLHVTFRQVLLYPPCLKEQASSFLLLSTAVKGQSDLVMFFSFIWQVAGCLMFYSNLSSKVYVHACSGCPKMVLSLSCSTPFTAIRSCSSCHLYLPLCTCFSEFWFNIKFELIFQLNLSLSVPSQSPWF